MHELFKDIKTLVLSSKNDIKNDGFSLFENRFNSF